MWLIVSVETFAFSLALTSSETSESGFSESGLTESETDRLQPSSDQGETGGNHALGCSPVQSWPNLTYWTFSVITVVTSNGHRFSVRPVSNR
jgi:hypothetical protein